MQNDFSKTNKIRFEIIILKIASFSWETDFMQNLKFLPNLKNCNPMNKSLDY